jgi:cation diffusion facilitator family transporter
MFSTKSGASKLALLVILGLVIAKITVTAITGSVSILAQLMDSLLDLIAVTITFFAINIATKPADKEHPFGHGKVENISAVIQAILIFTAAGAIIYSAINHIVSGAKIEMTAAGIGVMAASVIVSILLSRHLFRVAKKTDSLALEAIAHNIAADVYSATGVLVGLIAIRLTGLNILDPAIALAVSLIIMWSACKVMRESFGGLMDVRLPDDEENIIKSIITDYSNQIAGFSNLCTRKAGGQRYINFNLTMGSGTSLEEAHNICDRIEQDIEARLPNSTVTIHVEPEGKKGD